MSTSTIFLPLQSKLSKNTSIQDAQLFDMCAFSCDAFSFLYSRLFLSANFSTGVPSLALFRSLLILLPPSSLLCSASILGGIECPLMRPRIPALASNSTSRSASCLQLSVDGCIRPQGSRSPDALRIPMRRADLVRRGPFLLFNCLDQMRLTIRTNFSHATLPPHQLRSASFFSYCFLYFPLSSTGSLPSLKFLSPTLLVLPKRNTLLPTQLFRSLHHAAPTQMLSSCCLPPHLSIIQSICADCNSWWWIWLTRHPGVPCPETTIGSFSTGRCSSFWDFPQCQSLQILLRFFFFFLFFGFAHTECSDGLDSRNTFSFFFYGALSCDASVRERVNHLFHSW